MVWRYQIPMVHELYFSLTLDCNLYEDSNCSIASLSYRLASPITWYPDSSNLITVSLPIPLDAPVTIIDFANLISTWMRVSTIYSIFGTGSKHYHFGKRVVLLLSDYSSG